jgi:hypothetical protein
VDQATVGSRQKSVRVGLNVCSHLPPTSHLRHSKLSW